MKNGCEHDKCELVRLLTIFGKKWSLQILHSFSKDRVQTYNGIMRKTDKKINPTILSQRLKAFQKLGILEKDEKKNYVMTPFGVVVCETIFVLRKEALKNGYTVPVKCLLGNHAICCGAYKKELLHISG